MTRPAGRGGARAEAPAAAGGTARARPEALEAADVVASYPSRSGRPRRPALAGVSLRLGRGEVVGLIGPNGSGKTTLLRLLTRQLAPAAGRVLLGGRPLASFGRFELARHVAVVAQEPEVPVGFTVRETVAMGRAPHMGLLGTPGPEDARAVAVALTATGTLEFADRRIETLSGGERQRAVFARAVAQQPAFLLLDEPTNHLDLRYQVELLALAREQAASGVGVLAVLHDLNLAARACDRLVLLAEGRVAAAGAPAEVLRPDLLAATYRAAVEVLPSDGGPVIVPRF
ncbi:MAG TPA: ABC transporter ATP-binding protein [Trueperaceae bacterium]|nr:ABC transporter ATP-binding protein [Trueperaceae bacterium]